MLLLFFQLYELLYERQRGLVDERRQLGRLATAASQLAYSPFAALGMTLPTRLDVRSSRHVRVRGASGTRVVAALPTSTTAAGNVVDDRNELPPELQGFASIALVRANNAIPQSVPAFYFEVTIEHGGIGGGCGVSVGLYRDGLPLEGVPGHNSVAYGGDTGALYRTVDGDIAVEEFGAPFAVGDVVGCAIDTRRSVVYFTRNGSPIGRRVTNMSGRFYPCLWLMNREARVRINFGQRVSF